MRRWARWAGVTTFATLITAVGSCGGGGRSAVRTYYVAADEVEWDYVPSGDNRTMGRAFEGLELAVNTAAPDRLGRKFRKAIYREYTDSSFATLKPRAADQEYLGILGPLVRAVVGDTIRIVFRNHATRPYSVHPHGVFYNKDSEGAGYADRSAPADQRDNAVAPGATHTYVWPVPERAGPAHDDGSTAFWMYHSHVDEGADISAGLIGPMIITAREHARADGTPDDVDKELVVLFGEFDENGSHYYQHNVRTNADPARVPKHVTFADDFFNLNLRESLNGLSYGNVPVMTMRVGQRVRWYVFAASGFEIHAPHWHGQTAVNHHMRTDVLSLVTMQMQVADMVPDNPGTWMFHCHVAGHFMLGMSGMFRVDP